MYFFHNIIMGCRYNSYIHINRVYSSNACQTIGIQHS